MSSSTFRLEFFANSNSFENLRIDGGIRDDILAFVRR